MACTFQIETTICFHAGSGLSMQGESPGFNWPSVKEGDSVTCYPFQFVQKLLFFPIRDSEKKPNTTNDDDANWETFPWRSFSFVSFFDQSSGLTCQGEVRSERVFWYSLVVVVTTCKNDGLEMIPEVVTSISYLWSLICHPFQFVQKLLFFPIWDSEKKPNRTNDYANCETFPWRSFVFVRFFLRSALMINLSRWSGEGAGLLIVAGGGSNHMQKWWFRNDLASCNFYFFSALYRVIEHNVDLHFVTIKVGSYGYATGQQGSHGNTPPAGRTFYNCAAKG